MCSVPLHTAAVLAGRFQQGWAPASVGLGLTAVSKQRQRPHGPATKKKSEGTWAFSTFYILGCRGLNVSGEWISPDDVWLGGRQWSSAHNPALNWSSAQELKNLAVCIDLSPCTEGDKRFQNAGEGVCEATNSGRIHGTSTSFGILSCFSPFYTRLNFKVLWKMDGT